MKRKTLNMVVSALAIIVSFMLSSYIFSDWDNFKKGLTGQAEISKKNTSEQKRG
jgi:hypothetical protein